MGEIGDALRCALRLDLGHVTLGVIRLAPRAVLVWCHVERLRCSIKRVRGCARLAGVNFAKCVDKISLPLPVVRGNRIVGERAANVFSDRGRVWTAERVVWCPRGVTESTGPAVCDSEGWQLAPRGTINRPAACSGGQGFAPREGEKPPARPTAPPAMPH